MPLADLVLDALPLAQQTLPEPSLASRLFREESLAIIGAFTVPIAITWAIVWGKTRRREEELHAIAELARQGHTPEQIERLLKRTQES